VLRPPSLEAETVVAKTGRRLHGPCDSEPVTNLSRRWLPSFGLVLASLVLSVGVDASAAGSSDLTGKIWALGSLGTAKPVPGTTVTMQFAGGEVSGSTGCNSYSAGYKAGLRSLSIEKPVAATRKACAPAVSSQEHAFLSMLESVKRYQVRNGTLTLRGSAGRPLATFEVVSQKLAGTSRDVVAYNNGKQAVTSVLAGTRLTAAFSAKGTVSGNAGCNSYDASYHATPPGISLGPIASTRKSCSTPAGVMTQEAAYLAALQSAATYTTDGTRLELHTKSGATAVDLERR
jgi:heat shock protein HslJ